MRRSGEDVTIPDGWQMVRLGDVCAPPEYGANAAALPFDPERPRFVRITDITDEGRLRPSGARSVESAKALGYELGTGDLLFARSGSVGRTYLYRPEDGPCVFAGYLIRFRPKPEVALPRFVEIYAHSTSYYRWVASMLRAGAQPNINATEYSSLPILLPPLPEQRRIAAVLDAIDDAIERTNDVIAATERLRDTLLHDLLSHGIPGWHSEWREVQGLGRIPADWEVLQLGDVAEVKSGVGFPLGRQGRSDGSYPFIKVSDMTLEGNETYIYAANNYVDFHDVSELGANIFSPGTIVFPKVGAAIATNKKRVLTRPTIIDNNIAGVTVTDASRCNEDFLRFWFESVDLFQFANVSAVPSITGSRLKRAFVSLPPLPEQQAIAAMLDGTTGAIERARDGRDRIRVLKVSAADALLSGRVRVR